MVGRTKEKSKFSFLENAKTTLSFGGGLIHYGGQLTEELIKNGFVIETGFFKSNRIFTGRGLQLARLYSISEKRKDCSSTSLDETGGPQKRSNCWQDQKALIERLMSQVQ